MAVDSICSRADSTSPAAKYFERLRGEAGRSTLTRRAAKIEKLIRSRPSPLVTLLVAARAASKAILAARETAVATRGRAGVRVGQQGRSGCQWQDADPTFVAKHAREEEERLRRVAELRQAEAPLVEELRTVGCEVDSVWDLVNAVDPYPKALPILFDHLQRAYPAAVREGIARALAVPEAKFGRDVLTRLYREEQDARATDGLAVAISAVSDDDTIGDVIALARDARQGPSRLLLLSALER